MEPAGDLHSSWSTARNASLPRRRFFVASGQHSVRHRAPHLSAAATAAESTGEGRRTLWSPSTAVDLPHRLGGDGGGDGRRSSLRPAAVRVPRTGGPVGLRPWRLHGWWIIDRTQLLWRDDRVSLRRLPPSVLPLPSTCRCRCHETALGRRSVRQEITSNRFPIHSLFDSSSVRWTLP